VLRHARAAVLAAPRAAPVLLGQADSIEVAVAALALRLSGDPARQQLSQSDVNSIGARIYAAAESWSSRQPPTTTQRDGVASASTELAAVVRDLQSIRSGPLARLEAALEAAGAPSTPGRPPTR
jgi:hypothetical protein